MELGSNTTFGVTDVAKKLTYYHVQLQLFHWQTTSYAEHMALGKLYETVFDMKDEILEKLIGYLGTRPKAFQIDSIKNITDYSPINLVKQIEIYAEKLDKWASSKGYSDISQLSQTLSGESAKTLYLLTLK